MANKKSCIKFTILPLTPDLWPALEDLFGKSGASKLCGTTRRAEAALEIPSYLRKSEPPLRR
jgi:hypothetical protein